VYAAFRDTMHEWPAFELRDGIGDVLAWLHGRGLRLGLAANQPHATLDVLDAHGIGQYFHHREVSGTHGFRKPDVRLFLRCCEDLGVEPEQCIMVGDRIDNDIAPAITLGMRTVLFRTGRHAAQQPRSADEVPDAEVRDVPELRRALEALL
jgi:putative hydrolase of the HAD superfamily